jgi:hypothetical protein
MKGKVMRMASDRNYWRAFFVVVALVAAAGIPFFFGDHSKAQTATAGTLYIAVLTGPGPVGNAVPPGGIGHYFADQNNNQELDVDVNGIGLPVGTLLGVLVDGAPIGQIRLTSLHNGSLHLNTVAGQPVPTVNNGSSLVIKNGPNTILAGTFSPPVTPTPPPSRTPPPTPTAVFFAPLFGPTASTGVAPHGLASYAEFGSEKTLNIFVGHIIFPTAVGGHLDVFVGGTQVGELVLNNTGDGELRLDTSNGDSVPTVTAGTTAAIKSGSVTLLAGVFQSPTTHPTPSPTGTPPPPPPHPNRFFGGRINGDQVVPAVQTNGHGLIVVGLNNDESQIHVWCGFAGLSSDQTTAKIYGPAMPGDTASAIFDLGTIGGTAGRFPVQAFDVTAEQVEQLRNGLWYVQIGSTNHPDGEIRGQIRSHTRPSAFSGVQADDIAVYRPTDSTWYVKNDGGYTEQQLGAPGDISVSADYDGDGITDTAIFRNGTWLISRSSDNGITTKQFGMAGDIPVRGDYDGDGVADLAVFRPSTGVWYVEKSSGSGYTIVQFGMNGDQPVAADLDGDGTTDIALFRPSTGTWYWLGSKTGGFGAMQFGLAGDVPVVGDYDGDGTDDISVWRPSTGVWYVAKSTGGFDIRQFGTEGDVPVAGNYDDDGMTDIAVFRPSTGVWYIWRSSDGTFDYEYFGTNGDIPALR